MAGLLCLVLACPALAQKDAAEKVQEGNVNNWIEYYRQQREAAPAPPSAPVGEKRDERKEKRDERGDNREEIAPAGQGERRN